MSDIVSSVLVPKLQRLSTSSRRMSLPLTPVDASRQARQRLVDSTSAQLKAFTGIPVNSLNANQCKNWLAFSDDNHTRRVRVFLKTITRDDVADIKDSLFDLCDHYTVRLFLLVGSIVR